jgi:hypothetical protein
MTMFNRVRAHQSSSGPETLRWHRAVDNSKFVVSLESDPTSRTQQVVVEKAEKLENMLEKRTTQQKKAEIG